jgi:hypothetical protein
MPLAVHQAAVGQLLQPTTTSTRRRRPRRATTCPKDLADQAIQMIRDVKASAPSRPWLQWFCPGANHAPHHAPQEYIDKYKGQFDDGYKAYREWVLPRMIAKGILPEGTELTPMNYRAGPAGPELMTISALRLGIGLSIPACLAVGQDPERTTADATEAGPSIGQTSRVGVARSHPATCATPAHDMSGSSNEPSTS